MENNDLNNSFENQNSVMGENKQLKDKKKLPLIIIIILIVVALVAGVYFYKNMNYGEDKSNPNNDGSSSENEETDINPIKIIDIDEAPQKIVVQKEDISLTKDALTTSTKPKNYPEDYLYYRDGFVGYEDDSDEGEFVKLYECKNKELGKCGYAETNGVHGTYNLEEGLKIAQMGLSIINDQYIFVYDSDVYQKDVYSPYFSKEAPLIVYDIKNKKEVGRYSSLYDPVDCKRSDDSVICDTTVATDFDNKYGLIRFGDGKIENVIPFEYEYIGVYNDEYMLVQDGQYYVYDLDTETKIGPFNNQISSFSDNFIVTNEGSYNSEELNYRLYATSGKKLVVNSGNKYIVADEDYAIVVDSKDNLNVYDKDGKPILEKSIQLAEDGEYHVRCCQSLLKFSYAIEDDVMNLTVASRDQNDSLTMVEYTIDLKNGSMRKN